MFTDHTSIIKDKLNILDVVGPYVKLEKAGKTYKGKSPFTNERTPSFFVSPEKGFYYCFSSGKGGDIFNFIQEIERVDFKTSLKMLAERAGVKLESSPEAQQVYSEKERLYHLLDLATKFYEIQLRKNKEVVKYLLDRGLSKETIIRFRIGFAPESWDDLYRYLRSKKFTDHEIEKAGLITSKKPGSFYNRFRKRIMFPLMDGRGRVVGFSGRIFEGDEKSAKYVNSPEGLLFDKSKVLYGYHRAKSAISKQDTCIFVEGQFDVLLAQQSGYENTVAISGTGLSEYQIQMVQRFSNNFIFALDSDKAGIKATRRSILLAASYGIHAKVVQLRVGEDPADTIVRSKEAWDVAVIEAQGYIEYRIALAEKENLSFEQKQDLIYKDLFEIVYASKNASTKEHLLAKIALFLGVPLESLRIDFNQYEPQEVLPQQSLEEALNSSDEIHQQEPRSFDLEKELLYSLYYAQEYFTENFSAAEKEYTAKIQDIFDLDVHQLLEKLSEEEQAMYLFVFEEKKDIVEFHKLDNSIHELLDRLLITKLEQVSKEVREAIRKAQVLDPNTIPSELMKKSAEIRKRIDELKQD